MATNEREILNRLVRIESKLVRGFEELGVNIDIESDWITVDDATRTVYISTLGRSLTVMLSDMVRLGAKQIGKDYEIVHKGTNVGVINFRPTT
jgi:hypothetical protein